MMWNWNQIVFLSLLIHKSVAIGRKTTDKLILGSADTAITGRYIVQLDRGQFRAGETVRSVAKGFINALPGTRIDRVMENTLEAFSITVGGNNTMKALATLLESPRVRLVEQVQIVTVDEMVQVQPPWGLDRIDQRSNPLDGGYSYEFDGSGVNVCVLDTGVMSTHDSFVGANKVECIFDAFQVDGQDMNCEDENGHGTHVAGIVSAVTYGVAKGSLIKTIKVLGADGSGASDAVIAGVDACVGHSKTNARPYIANLSLGSRTSPVLDDAVNRAVRNGVFMTVAAGNAATDACLFSPASAVEAMTVGATSVDDRRASFSNYGSCLDLFAPGESIASAFIGNTKSVKILSGTSMASPHVAGFAARLAQELGGSPTDIRAEIIRRASKGILSDVRGSPNLFLFTAPLEDDGFDDSDRESLTDPGNEGNSGSAKITDEEEGGQGNVRGVVGRGRGRVSQNQQMRDKRVQPIEGEGDIFSDSFSDLDGTETRSGSDHSVCRGPLFSIFVAALWLFISC